MPYWDGSLCEPHKDMRYACRPFKDVGSSLSRDALSFFNYKKETRNSRRLHRQLTKQWYQFVSDEIEQGAEMDLEISDLCKLWKDFQQILKVESYMNLKLTIPCGKFYQVGTMIANVLYLQLESILNFITISSVDQGRKLSAFMFPVYTDLLYELSIPTNCVHVLLGSLHNPWILPVDNTAFIINSPRSL